MCTKNASILHEESSMIRYFLKSILISITLLILYTSIKASEAITAFEKAQEIPEHFLCNFFSIDPSVLKIPKDVQYLIAKEIDDLFCPFLIKKPLEEISIEADSSQDENDLANCITISHDNKHIAYVIFDTCTILNTETLEKTSGGSIVDLSIRNIAFNNDDSKIALLSTGGTIKVVSLINYKAVTDDRTGDECPSCLISANRYILSFTPQNTVAVASLDSDLRQVVLFDPETENTEVLYTDYHGDYRSILSKGVETKIGSISFNTDASQVMCVSITHGLEVFSLSEKKWSYPLWNEGPNNSGCRFNTTYSKDNKKLFHPHLGHIQLWDLETKELITRIIPKDNSRIGGTMHLTQNEKYILVQGYQEKRRLYHINTAKLVVQIMGLDGVGKYSYLSNDSSLFAGYNNCYNTGHKSFLLFWKMNPFWEQLESLLFGRIRLEQVFFIKFLKLLKNQGLTLTNKGIILSKSHIDRTEANDETLPYPTPLTNGVIKYLLKVFKLFDEPVAKYLKLQYLLDGFNKA